MKKEKEKTIKQLIEEEINNKIFTYSHKFQHYSFQMDLHPSDSRKMMERNLKSLHLDRD
jgi:hypothetical protein